MIASLTWFLFWFLKRGGFILTRKRVVAFCLKCESGTERHLYKTIRDLRDMIRNLQLEDRIIIRRIGEDLVTDKESALKYVNRSAVDLVFSGYFDQETVGGKTISVINRARCTGRTHGCDKNTILRIVAEVALLIGGRTWQVRSGETHYDLQVLVEGFCEIVLYIIAADLFFERNFGDAARVANALLMLLSESPIANQRSSALLAKRGRELLFAAEMECAQTAPYPSLTIPHLKNARKLGVGDYTATVQLAWAYYQLGQEDKARELTNELVQSWPNEGVTLLNEAFFAIKDCRYDYATELYRRLIGLRQPDVAPMLTLEVYASEYKKNPKELGYIFGSGLINFWFCDEGLGKRDLRQFIGRTKGKPVYKHMRRVALDIVNSPKRETRGKRQGKRK